MDTKKYSGVMFNALEMANNITPSVLAVAEVLGVKPKALADAIVADSVATYRAEVALHIQKSMIEKAVADEKEAEKKGE